MVKKLCAHLNFPVTDTDKDEEQDYVLDEICEYLKLDAMTQELLDKEGFAFEAHILNLGKSRKFPENLAFVTRLSDRSKMEIYMDERLGDKKEAATAVKISETNQKPRKQEPVF